LKSTLTIVTTIACWSSGFGQSHDHAVSSQLHV
jgi:hypothetical protein